jgi:phosphoribosylaminoimidazolecarboxamide formyltransferase/IMP cyclohydrolase
MRALLSVYDKTGIADLAAELVNLGWEIVSTGGTYREIHSRGIPVLSVSAITGFPEILDGRVKTLHPNIHGGLLGRPNLASDAAQLKEHGITPLALLAVNLYPFEATIRRDGVTEDEAIEQIDIGGPAMLRAAAKNHQYVIPVVDPASYLAVIQRLRAGTVDRDFRRSLAARAFAHTGAYDVTVSGYFQRADDTVFPDQLVFSGKKISDLRYGENPHQKAAAYRSSSLGGQDGVLGAQQLQGKELSFNNLLDADTAWQAVQDWHGPSVAIVKHTIPCGLAEAETLAEAYERALAGDPISAFGGIVATNRPIDEATAELLSKTFFEVIVTSGFEVEALTRLSRKKQLRLLEIDPSANRQALLDLKAVSGGWLIQEADAYSEDESAWQVITDRRPTAEEVADLRFAWKAVRHVKSNAIVLAKQRAIVGVGSGQPNRVESVGIAVRKAAGASAGSVLASDAFFPFADGVVAAASAGVTAIIQPGGSVRDEEVLSAANTAGMAMIMTGRRHFKH